MSFSVWRYIRGDLRRILLSISGIPDVRYELAPKPDPNLPDQPPAGVAYIRERIEKGPTTPGSAGSLGTVQENGIYHVDLYWPDTLARVDGEDLADKIRLTFWPARELGSSGPDPMHGRVLRSEARQAIPGAGWVVFPVRITFFVRRNTAQGRA